MQLYELVGNVINRNRIVKETYKSSSHVVCVVSMWHKNAQVVVYAIRVNSVNDMFELK